MPSPSFAELTELVVPLDGREASVRAVPVAGRLAERFGIGVRLFAASNGSDTALETWMREVAAEHLPDMDVVVDTVAADEPVAAIVEAAGDRGLVCMATAASLRPHQGHVGSVAEGVARDLGRPMFMVGPHMEAHPGEHTQRVIVPVDGSRLSEAALGVGADLAVTFGVPLWVVSVISRRTEAVSTVSDRAETGYVRSLARDVRHDHGIEASYDVLHWDDPARGIVDFAGDDGTVVMSTHGRSGLSRVFGGSVTTAVVAHSHRAVVVLRPGEDE